MFHFDDHYEWKDLVRIIVIDSIQNDFVRMENGWNLQTGKLKNLQSMVKGSKQCQDTKLTWIFI